MRRNKTKLLVFSLLSLTLTGCGTNIDDIEDESIGQTEVHAESLKVKEDSITLYAGETYQIEYEITPSDAIEDEVVYSVSLADVCTVSETGLIKANQYSGSTTVRVALKDRPGVYDEIKVTTRRRVLVNEITCSVSSFDFYALNQTIDFTYSVFPLNAKDKDVEIYVEDPSIASLSEDKTSVTSLKNGETNLVIKALESGSSVETKVPIIVNDDYGEEVSADPSLNPTQYLTYKELMSTDGQDMLTSTATREDPANVLVIPVEFSDVTFDDAYNSSDGETKIKDELEIAFNGTSEETNYWESVASYFEKSSFGNLYLNFDIGEVVTLSYATSDLLEDYVGIASVINSAFNTYKRENEDIDYTRYDYDKDGIIDSVWLIYSAPDYITDPSYEDQDGDFWAFVTSFTNPVSNLSSPGIGTFGWASYDFMYQKEDGQIDAHTYIHETGHLMGLNDYYDYTYMSEPLGMYDMQDCNVGDHNVWTKAALGRINPIIIDTSKNIPAKVHLNPREDGGAIFITNGYSKTAFDEFLVLELYTPNGLNELDSTYEYSDGYGLMPKESGVKMYHVDARLISGYQAGRQYYYDLDSLSEGVSEDTTLLIGASNTSSSDRNYTVELFNQIELISSNKSGQRYQSTVAPYTSEDFFQTGDSFDMKSYRYFTYRKSGLFNNGDNLNIKISFLNVSEDGADIVIDFLEK